MLRLIFQFPLLRRLYFDKLGWAWIRRKVAPFVTHLEQNDKIVDIGSGNGLVCFYLREKGFDVTPLDVVNMPFDESVTPVVYNGKLMPFDNTLVLIKLSPEKARECAKYMFEKKGQPIYNAKFKLSENSEQMWIGGEEYKFDEDIVVITSDYLASGGDKMNFFAEPLLKYDTGKFLRDVFIDYVKEKKELGAYELTGKFEFTD